MQCCSMGNLYLALQSIPGNLVELSLFVLSKLSRFPACSVVLGRQTYGGVGGPAGEAADLQAHVHVQTEIGPSAQAFSPCCQSLCNSFQDDSLVEPTSKDSIMTSLPAQCLARSATHAGQHDGTSKTALVRAAARLAGLLAAVPSSSAPQCITVQRCFKGMISCLLKRMPGSACTSRLTPSC